VVGVETEKDEPLDMPPLQLYVLAPLAVKDTLEPVQTIALDGAALIVSVGKALIVKLRFIVILQPAAFVIVMMPLYIPAGTFDGIAIEEIVPPEAFETKLVAV
jgi:hypothetical protein